MEQEPFPTSARGGRSGADRGLAALGSIAGLGALFSAAACCVLPLALAGMGIGSAGLATFVPFRWPLTLGAALFVAAGWFLYLRRKRRCAADTHCAVAPPARMTFAMLGVASAFVIVSSLWALIEAPLLRLMGGA